jgi:hypothetical protein
LGVLAVARQAPADFQGLPLAEEGDPVMPLLTVEMGAVSHPLDGVDGELRVRHLALLDPQDIRVQGAPERLQLMGAGADPVDIE